MANTIISNFNGSTNTTTANTTEFWPCLGSANKSTTETTTQLIFRTAGTASNMFLNVGSNAIAGTSTVDFRINAASSALTISVGSSATGKFEDTTHTVSITAGQKGNFRTVPGATTNTMTPEIIGIMYDTGSTSTQKHASMNPAGKVMASGNGKFYYGLTSNATGAITSEAAAEALMKQAGTAKNLQCNISPNARANATTIALRKAAASTALTITVAATTPGFFEDTTNTVSIVAGDLINYWASLGTGTTSMTLLSVGVDIESSAGYGSLIMDVGGGTSQTAGTTRYNNLIGALSLLATETKAQYTMRNTFTFTNMNAHVDTNTASTLTYTLRKNAAATALTWITGSAATGYFEDNTHTVTVALGDLVDIEAITAAGSVVIWSCGVIYTQVVAAGANITKSLTETVAISESLARLAAKTRTRTETITISESPTRLSAKIRAAPSQTVTISDAVARVKGKVKTLTETVTISTASLALLRNKIRTATETVTISSTPARLSTKFRALAAETVTISSTVARVRGVVKTLSETITLSSTVARLTAKSRPLAESVSISSTVARIKSVVKTISETVTISSTVARIKGIPRSLTETVTTSSTVTRLAAKIRTRTETVTISSTPARLSSKIRNLTETVTISSTVTRIKGAVKAITETVTISSTVARLAAKIRPITQTITISDSVTRAKSGAQNIVRTLTETVTISSTVTNARAKIRTLTESISLSDTPTRLAAKRRALTPESITIGATIPTRIRGRVKALTETLSATSTLTRLSKKIRTLAETITILDSVTRTPPGIQPKQPHASTVSILAQELRSLTTVTKDLQRFLLETTKVSDHVKIEVKQYSKIIKVQRVKKLVRLVDLVKLADSVYNNKRRG